MNIRPRVTMTLLKPALIFMALATALPMAGAGPAAPAAPSFEQPWAVGDAGPRDGTATVYISSTPVRSEFPRDLFGLHLMFPQVWGKLYHAGENAMAPGKVQDLRNAGVELLRYGGHVNSRDWRQCKGPLSSRPVQTLGPFEWDRNVRCDFGFPEYFALMNQLWEGTQAKRNLLICANVVGYDPKHREPLPKLPEASIADDAGAFAAYVKSNAPANSTVLYELGNEAEKGRTFPEFSTGEYISRLKAVEKSILSRHPEARIIVPLLHYTPSSRLDYPLGHEWHNKKLITEVGSPKNDYALHLYYDAYSARTPYGQADRTNQVQWDLEAIQAAIKTHREATNGKSPNIWITEHARFWDAGDAPPRPNKAIAVVGHGRRAEVRHDLEPRRFAGWDHLGALSTADFLTGLVQIPEVAGANWHSLTGNPWYFLPPVADPNDPDPLYPTAFKQKTPMQQLFELLSSTRDGRPLLTKTYSLNKSRYPGGYDIRAAAFLADGSGGTERSVSIWLINRSASSQQVRLALAPGWLLKRLPDDAGKTPVGYKGYVSSTPGDDDPPVEPAAVSGPVNLAVLTPADGRNSVYFEAAPRSYYVLTLQLQAAAAAGPAPSASPSPAGPASK